MKIISFNINGLRARPHQIEALLAKHSPDFVGLQEIKVHDDEFPLEEMHDGAGRIAEDLHLDMLRGMAGRQSGERLGRLAGRGGKAAAALRLVPGLDHETYPLSLDGPCVAAVLYGLTTDRRQSVRKTTLQSGVGAGRSRFIRGRILEHVSPGAGPDDAQHGIALSLHGKN